MNDLKKIGSVLISVYHKDKSDTIIRHLDKLGAAIYSTGGTRSFIEGLGVKVTDVETLTGYPSIFGGRVKTLHPRIFGGILSRRDNEDDRLEAAQYDIPDIDMVIVDLYPFEETVAGDASVDDIIEKIDIGGISLIRAAAKNFNDVLIVSSRDQYERLTGLLEEKGGYTSLSDRMAFAMEAFAVSSHYDSAIFGFFSKMYGENPDNSQPDRSPHAAQSRISLNDGHLLRYGENPHQKAVFFRFDNGGQTNAIAAAPVLQGKEMSYNNMLDADAAWKAASDAYAATSHIDGRTAVAVVKHLNPCGLAVSSTIMESLELAWAGDPVSAYGGIVCFTETVTAQVAEWFANRFVEIIIAPDFTPDALDIFSKKKNLRLLAVAPKIMGAGEKTYRSVSGGMLVQDEDEGHDNVFENVTKAEFPAGRQNLALFGIAACKHLKSNAIALVSETPGGSLWLTGAGMGQPNRLDSLRRLAVPRFLMKEGVNIEEAVMVSDAFFPFRDSIEAANEYGIRYIVEPGGSVRDPEVIEACNEYGIAMLFTGKRHFRH